MRILTATDLIQQYDILQNQNIDGFSLMEWKYVVFGIWLVKQYATEWITVYSVQKMVIIPQEEI